MTLEVGQVGVISLDIFNLDVAVFCCEEDRFNILTEEGCDPDPHPEAAIASSHVDTTEKGDPRISMVIKHHASRAVWVHECSHIADFVCDVLGIPLSMDTTEVRAYLTQYLFAELEDLLGAER